MSTFITEMSTFYQQRKWNKKKKDALVVADHESDISFSISGIFAMLCGNVVKPDMYVLSMSRQRNLKNILNIEKYS